MMILVVCGREKRAVEGGGCVLGEVLMHLWYHTLRVNFWYNAKNISS